MKYDGSLDANLIVRTIMGDIPHLAQAAKALIDQENMLYVSDTAIIETLYAMEKHYRVPKPEICQAVTAFLQHPHIVTNIQFWSNVLDLYKQHHALSAEDCYLACDAKRHNAVPLWTFDQKLAKQSGNMAKLL